MLFNTFAELFVTACLDKVLLKQLYQHESITNSIEYILCDALVLDRIQKFFDLYLRGFNKENTIEPISLLQFNGDDGQLEHIIKKVYPVVL